jgi:hypothetical protein
MNKTRTWKLWNNSKYIYTCYKGWVLCTFCLKHLSLRLLLYFTATCAILSLLYYAKQGEDRIKECLVFMNVTHSSLHLAFWSLAFPHLQVLLPFFDHYHVFYAFLVILFFFVFSRLSFFVAVVLCNCVRFFFCFAINNSNYEYQKKWGKGGGKKQNVASGQFVGSFVRELHRFRKDLGRNGGAICKLHVWIIESPFGLNFIAFWLAGLNLRVLTFKNSMSS